MANTTGITSKTTRAQLIYEIERLTVEANGQRALYDSEIFALQTKHKAALDGLTARVERLETEQAEDIAARESAERNVEVLATDIDNLIGAIRVIADPSRPIRVRASTVKPLDAVHVSSWHSVKR